MINKKLVFFAMEQMLQAIRLEDNLIFFLGRRKMP